VRIKINAPECPLSRFYSDLGLLPWSKTGDFGEKRAKPDSLLGSTFYLSLRGFRFQDGSLFFSPETSPRIRFAADDR
jgi:hypothetical protein